MLLQIWQEGALTEVDLADGIVELGGSPQDGVMVEGLPVSALRLLVDGRRLTVVPRETIEIGGVLTPPKVARLLLPGEEVELAGGVKLVQPPLPEEADARRRSGTAAVVRQLLLAIGEPEHTRAACLVCLSGKDTGRRFPLGFSRGVIGRGAGVEVRVRDQAVSRRHARLLRSGQDYLVEDLGAPNGVFLNGGRVRKPARLAPGDVLEVGQSILRFEGPEEPPEEKAKLAPSPTEPSEPQATEPESKPRPQASTSRTDWLLLGLGATLAAGGILVGWVLC